MSSSNPRLAKFTSVFGENWVTGRYLMPRLRTLGQSHYNAILDLACGDSPYRGYFPDVGRYLRVDYKPRDPEVMDGDMRAIPLADGSVDLVILSQALSDVPAPADVLRELVRVLVPGGRVIVFESMCYPEHDMPHDYYRLMPAGLTWQANEIGMIVAELTYLGGLFTRFASLWNSCVMGALKRFALLRPFAALGTAAGNLACYALDRIAMHPRLASDYLAVLQVPPLNDSTKQTG